MPVEIEAPDGSVVEFPDGTPPDVMTRAMRTRFGGPASASATPAIVDAPRPDTRSFRAPILPNTQPSDVSRTMGDPIAAGGRAAIRGVVPATAGAAAFGPGFVTGGTLGAGLGGPIGGLVGGLGGGLATAMGGSYLAQEAQTALTNFVPESIKRFFGQDDTTIAADTKQFPVATQLGAAAPNLAFMAPGVARTAVREGATLLERVLASPKTGVAVGATLGGGIEAGSEFAREGKIDPQRVAVATGIGALLNRPTRLGESLMVSTGNATIRGMQAAARTAGTVTRGAQTVAADIAQKARNAYGPAGEAVVDVTATPVAPADAARLPGPVEPAAPPAPAAVDPTMPLTGAPPPEFTIAPRPIPPATLPSFLVEGSLPAPMQSPPTGGDGQGAALRPDPGDLGDGEQYVTTPAGNRVRARFEVVPAASLIAAEGELQNRDRSRDSTALQVQDIVANFDPSRLGMSAESDRGAPIVGPDGIIESGNGRIMALNRVFAEAPDKAAAYRAMIEAQGLSTEGIENPVLIRRRMTDFTPEQRRQFVLDSNADAKLALTSVERARGDADTMDADSLALFKGGDVGAAGNASFVKAFMSRLPAGERGALVDANGQLSQDGISRIENALMARAYENPDVLSKVIENRDNNIRSIGGALVDAAAPWATFRAAVKAGEVKPEFDVTDKLVEAARIVSDLRARGEYVKDFLASNDAFNPLDPVTEQFIRGFYNTGLSRAAGRDAIGEVLAAYARRASEQTTAAGLFGDEPAMSPAELMQSVIADRDNAKLGGLFGVAAEERLPVDVPRANEDGEMTPEFEKHIAEAQEEADAIEADGGKALFHGTAGPRQDADPRGLGMMFWAEEARYAERYAGAGGGGRQASSTGRIEVREAPENILDITTPKGLAVLAGLPKSGFLAARVIAAAGRGAWDASDQLWSLTKTAGKPGAADLRAGIVEPLRALGYQGIRFKDDIHPTVAIFEEQSNANDTNRAQSRDEGGDVRAPGEDEFTGSESERQRGDGSAPQRRDEARGPRAGDGQRNDGSVRRGRRSGAGIQEDAAKLAAAAEIEDGAPDYSEGRPPAVAEDKGAYQPSFMEASFTNRSSLYEYAVTDISGLTPDEFRLKSPEAQVALMQRGMAAKFGIKVSVDPQLQRRFAIDQMLDAYQNMQGMAHILGIAPEAMSLGGKLSLRLEKKVRALGWFQPGKNVIGLPKRSNSFAHEWGHALDWTLLELYGGDEAAKGLTGDVRKDGADFEPRNVQQAFVKLLNAMFFDEAAMAAKMMVLERRIEATDSDKQKAQFQAQIDNYRSGRSRAKEKSTFYEGARVLDRGPDGYFASPTEMFARAFEAYTSFHADLRGLGTEFIGKGDANYLSNAEGRFAKSFPKGEERAAIFAAFDDLFVELNKEAVLGDAPAAAAPRMDDLRKISDFDRLTRKAPQGGLMRRQMDAIEAQARQRAKEQAGRPANPQSTAQRVENLVANVAYSMTGLGRMMERRYPNAPAIKEMMNLLTYREGKGQYVGEGFEAASRARANTSHNRLTDILRRHDLDGVLTTEQDRMLRDLLIGETVADAPANFTAGAADIRRLLDEEFYANQNAGLDIGYARNGYLPRILDMPLVMGDEGGFTAAAGEVYKIVFDKEFGADPQEVLAGENFVTFMRLAARYAKAGLVDIDAVKNIRDIAKRLGKVDDPEGDGAGISAELQNELEEALAEIYDPVRDAFAEEKANAWLSKLKLTSDMDFDAHAPDGDYMKNRTLPPEADKLMEAFYLQNPVEAIYTYLGQSARRTTYAKLFGPKGEKRKELFEAMAAQGVLKQDQAQLAHVLDIATGRVRSSIPQPVQGFLSFVQAAGTITLLPRAVLSSLTEAVTAGLRTGDMRDGMKALSTQIAGSLGSPNGKQRAELARALGIIVDSGADEVNAARFGGNFGDATKWTKLTTRMFQRTGLTALTRAQRTHMTAISNAFLDLMLRRVAAKEDLANSRALLLELGIRDPEAFSAEWLAREGAMPGVDELDTPFAQDYGVAMRRFIDQTIQNPTLMDRPVMANNPAGRVLFGIMSFSYSFWRNILKRNAILLREQAKRDGGGKAGKTAAGLLGAAALLFALQGTVSTIREYMLNRRRWNELKEKDELEKTMLQLAATRSFSFGAVDPLIQGFTGLKYQRDFSNIFIGAAPGFFLQGAQKMAMPFVSDSDKTNTAEYGAAQGFYQTFTAPALAFGLMSLPGGPILTPLTGAGVALGTAPVARDAFATAVVGEKDKRGKKKHSASP